MDWAASYNSDLYVTVEIQAELKLPLHLVEAKEQKKTWKGYWKLAED